MRCKLFFKKHWVAIALAFVAGIIVILPQLLLSLENDYKGISAIMGDSEEHYLAVIREVHEGHLKTGGVFSVDKNEPYCIMQDTSWTP